MKNQLYLQRITNKSVLCFVIIMASCKEKTNIDVQGHRGCRGLYPENSIPAFNHAISLGVNTLELDIAITKDNKVVVSHEPFMSRVICIKPDGTQILKTEDKQFNLYEMTHDEIKTFDCGTKIHPRFVKQKKRFVYKPLLKEVFDLVKNKKRSVKFNIEIKSKPSYYGNFTPFPAEYVALVLNTIEDAKMLNHVNLQSFDITILEEIKKQSPKMEIALLVDENEDINIKLSKLSFKPQIISPYYKLIDKNMVESLQIKKFTIIPWTVNTKKDLMQMIDYKVDGIITDYPNKLIALLQGKKPKISQ